MRWIAIKAGRGNISSSSVHNLFRQSRVPRWDFLEHVVKALGGAEERDAFLILWQAAERAENHVAAPLRAPADLAPFQGQAADYHRIAAAAAPGDTPGRGPGRDGGHVLATGTDLVDRDSLQQQELHRQGGRARPTG